MYLSEREKGNGMWAYYNYEGMSVRKMYVFETKEEAYEFIHMGMRKNMEEYPYDPDMWDMLGEDIGTVFDLGNPMTAEQAYANWFGEKA